MIMSHKMILTKSYNTAEEIAFCCMCYPQVRMRHILFSPFVNRFSSTKMPVLSFLPSQQMACCSVGSSDQLIPEGIWLRSTPSVNFLRILFL